VRCLRIPDDGPPYLEGSKCAVCEEVFVGERPPTGGKRVCARCGGIETLTPVRLADTGTLYNYTIVHRSFPGTAVPFISAIVKLDGGGVLRGNLIDVEPTPEALAFDMPVRVVFRDAGRQDKDGNAYLSYFFTPA